MDWTFEALLIAALGKFKDYFQQSRARPRRAAC